MTRLTAYEIGEDGGMWLVVGQMEVLRESISVAEARLAVIALLREQLLPADEEVFMSETLVALDAPASIHWSAIYSRGSPCNSRRRACSSTRCLSAAPSISTSAARPF